MSPVTEWFIRVRFPAVVPERGAAHAVFAAAGLSVLATSDADRGARWLRVGAASHEHVTRAIGNLRHTHRIDCHALRAL